MDYAATMIVALLFVFILLQISDCLTTVCLLKGGGREANPILAWAFDKIGIATTLIVIKSVLVSLMFVLWNEWMTLALNVWFLGIVSWNSYQIWKTAT